ncbi:RDD family protein [Mycolicibacterium sediminis]|uniref:RDD domain-containing protein n=1 Tax=Mycolicibacterium sediminis TaxID=1286180 RepID=A0A7I7QYQ6_9MYCO|nr:RDD family protein [Mycolicibacterium sediminis]BBY31432.1 hypothetical protein MSEDJ_55280 [Mycolicibacterium sediminis]
MTQPPSPPGEYPPPPPSGGGYQPPQGGGYQPPQGGGYQPPQGGGYQPPPQGNYPPPPQGNYPPPPSGQAGYPPPPGAPAQVLPKESYTPWFTRVLAWIIDTLPAAILAGIGQGIAIATGDNDCVTSSTGYEIYCSSSYSGVGILAVAVTYIAALAYVVWNYGYRQGTTGSSVGKSVMKFKVVSEKTWQPIGFGPSIVRQIAHVVDGIICYIGYLFPLWDAKRQTLADKIMTTVCVPL